MQYDVFISYSRKDAQEVNSLIDRLRREIPGIKIWFDIEGVESADIFISKIIEAIDNSSTIIFVCSENSMVSEYCRKEVMYAYSVKKTIVPYLLPFMQLKGWPLFMFSEHNCVFSTNEDQVQRMIKDLKKWSKQTPFTDNSQKPKTISSTKSEIYFDSITGDFVSKPVLTGNPIANSVNGLLNGHEYVDFGLPSGLLWSTCYVGASKPEGYGAYYAWGETKTKSVYTIGNSETYKKEGNWFQKKFVKDVNIWLLDNGFIDSKGNLTLEHDAARQNWGAPWRMPTKKEFDELVNNTTSEWINYQGVWGRIVKSKKNSKSIFLSAAGWPTPDTISYRGSNGSFWCSTVSQEDNTNAFRPLFDKMFLSYQWGSRYLGCSIRAVAK